VIGDRISQASRQGQTGLISILFISLTLSVVRENSKFCTQKRNGLNHWMVSGYWNGNCLV